MNEGCDENQTSVKVSKAVSRGSKAESQKRGRKKCCQRASHTNEISAAFHVEIAINQRRDGGFEMKFT
jgi:hypothetical protein